MKTIISNAYYTLPKVGGGKWSHYDVKELWLEQAVHGIFAAVNPKELRLSAPKPG